jgi:hypothetical protein
LLCEYGGQIPFSFQTAMALRDRENASNVVNAAQPMTARGQKQERTKLSADWQLSAALLSRPVDLSALVTLSARSPEAFMESSVLHRIAQLLNSPNVSVSDKKCKVDILAIFGNLARHEEHREAVRGVILTISEWFEEYMAAEEGGGAHAIAEEVRSIDDIEDPALFKKMLITLARTYDYSLRSEDLLELTHDDTVLGLATVIGVLEEGFEEEVVVAKTRAAGRGACAQWEQRTVTRCHEKPLVLQLCRLLRGFTLPATYFKAEGGGGSDAAAMEGAAADHRVDEFRGKINQLLAITLDCELVEKVTAALVTRVFPEEFESLQARGSFGLEDGGGGSDGSDDDDDDAPVNLLHADHLSIISLQRFMHNLYNFANELYLPLFRQHLLVESRVTPDMILPYLQACLTLCAEAYADPDPRVAAEGPEEVVVDGISASLKTLVISTFQASAASPAVQAFFALNPTATMVQCCWELLHRNVSIFALLVFFNVNINSLNIAVVSAAGVGGAAAGVTCGTGANSPHALLHCFAAVFAGLERPAQKRLLSILAGAAGLPVSRESPSYGVVWGMLSSIYGANMNADNKESLVQRVDKGAGAAGGAAAAAGAEEAQPKKSVLAEAGGGGEFSLGGPTDDFDSDLLAPTIKPGAIPDATDADAAVAAAPATAVPAPAKASSSSSSSSSSLSSSSTQGTNLMLLGDLPSLVPGNSAFRTQEKKSRRKAKKEKKRALAAGEVPHEFKCAINGHIMRQPVRSPDGALVFEKATLEQWHLAHGSVCPITGAPLDIASLEVDAKLSDEIAKWHVKKAMDNPSAFEVDCFANEACDDEDDDLYNF